MQLKFFTIPLTDNLQDEEELNKFLRSHKILDIKQQFVSNNSGDYWSFVIKYLNKSNVLKKTKAERIDYREVLDTETFAKFSILRDCRAQIAKEAGLPVYAVFLNDELAKISQLKEITLEEAKKINGIGKKKAENYLNNLLKLYENIVDK